MQFSKYKYKLENIEFSKLNREEKVYLRRDFHLYVDSLERRWSSRRFSYGYLVTTSPQSSTPPSTAGSKKVASRASGVADSHGVTGGVYKARERIHRDILIRDY